jgi:hypothetical protein
LAAKPAYTLLLLHTRIYVTFEVFVEAGVKAGSLFVTGPRTREGADYVTVNGAGFAPGLVRAIILSPTSL